MTSLDARKAMWAKVSALYAAYWPGRGALTPATIVALEAGGLAQHSEDAVLAAVTISGRTSKHPAGLADLMELLEGVQRRVPVYQTDVWGRIVLGNDGARIVKGWMTEREEPAAYAKLRLEKGLPEPARAPRIAYTPTNVDRPESDGGPSAVPMDSDLTQLVDGVARKLRPA